MVMVYCIKCHKLVDKKHALDIMKTGFYKNDIPVANSCLDCDASDNDSAKEIEQGSIVVRENS